MTPSGGRWRWKWPKRPGAPTPTFGSSKTQIRKRERKVGNLVRAIAEGDYNWSLAANLAMAETLWRPQSEVAPEVVRLPGDPHAAKMSGYPPASGEAALRLV